MGGMVWGTTLALGLAAAVFTLCQGLAVPPLPTGGLAGYLTAAQTAAYLHQLHTALPGLVSEPLVIGQSVEKRDILAICVGPCTGAGGKALFTALHHSREVSRVSRASPRNARLNAPLLRSPLACTCPWSMHDKSLRR